MEVKIEEGANVQITDKQIVNNIIYGDVVQQKVVSLSEQSRTSKNENNLSVKDNLETGSEDLFLFIHPSISDDQERQIHNEVKRLVTRQGIQEICDYLKKLADDHKILLPMNMEKAYNELVRMGMPNGEGFSLKTFMKYYKR